MAAVLTYAIPPGWDEYLACLPEVFDAPANFCNPFRIGGKMVLSWGVGEPSMRNGTDLGSQHI
jgi:hypothetical protein